MLKFLGGGGATFIQGGTSIPESRVEHSGYRRQTFFVQLACGTQVYCCTEQEISSHLSLIT